MSLSPDKNPVFLLRFFEKGEIFAVDEDTPSDNQSSTWTLSSEQRNAIVRACDLWAEIIQPAKGNVPALIHVGTMEDSNASATSPTFFDDNGKELPYLVLQAHIQGLKTDTDQTAQIEIGKLNGGDYALGGTSQLPMSAKPDLQGIMVHEVGHALGVLASYSYDEVTKESLFEGTLNLYTQNMYAVDENGDTTQATPNMTIVGNDGHVPQDGSPYFDLRPDKVYFSGPNVREVLQGALLGKDADLPGIPINNESSSTGEDDPDLSHFEMINGQMSHQNYRNYTIWMEAELAILQDMGYVIDRKNFFGTSIYSSGVAKTITQGFFGRNVAGTAYVDGTYNTATLGLGLHIYGSNNTITQQGDILIRGEAGTGVRVDGASNIVTIARGTSVRADGLHGTGLMVAYGNNHTVNLQGDMQALGTGGIGARFDFGNNVLGNTVEYRGSYITTVQDANEAVLPELEGPLVSTFNIGGRLAGSEAALYISPNAWVENINVLAGAWLEGAIVSDWDDRATFVQLPSGTTKLHTSLNFGVYSNGAPDPSFAMRYDGAISGATLNMRHAGGALSYNGVASVNSVTVLENARLSGNGNYTVADGFFNAGLVAPGNSLGLIRVNGDYTQLPTGKLQMEFDGTGQHDVLSVSGNLTLNAGASAVLMPIPSFFSAPVQLDLADMIQSGNPNALSALQVDLLQLPSPTLRLAFSHTGTTLGIVTKRTPDAYSQYATTGNARQVGLALTPMAQSARDDMQRLFVNLDFAPVNVIDEALNQLSPAAYSSIAQAAVDASAAQSAMIVHRMINPGAREQGTDERPWTGFMVPFGSTAHQENRQDMVGYSVNSVGGLTGVERWFDNGIMAGLHAVFEHSELNTRTDARNKSDSFAFGVHALAKPETWNGAYMYGLARAGVASNKLYRDIEFANYQRKTKSDWTGYQASATLGGGYDWQAGGWTFGPVLDMNYDLVTRPGLTESQGEAARLRVDGEQYHSVHSKAGFRAAITAPVGNAQVSADMNAGWKHLWTNAPRTHATFAGYDESFSTETGGWGKDSLHLQAALHAEWDNNVFVRAQIESDLLRAGYSAVQGSLSVGFSF